MLPYLFQPKTQEYQFYNTHYNIVYSFDSSSRLEKAFMDINQQVQNAYYKEIQQGLKISNIQFADSTKKMDANYFLKYMGQAKTNLLCFDNRFEMKYVNYCYSSSINDTDKSYSINKVALLKKTKNHSKLYSVYTISGKKASIPYKQLGLEFVYEIKIIDNKIYYLGLTDIKSTKLFQLKRSKRNHIQAIEKQFLLENYFDYLRFVNNHIEGYKTNPVNNSIECFSFKF